ncbi:MAG: ornithine carbamoyltransferase [Chloroflexota bacterium]|nr:ornithine carbamoyltransferase [Chloroflexota bacterium]
MPTAEPTAPPATPAAPAESLEGRDVLTLADFTGLELRSILDRAHQLKALQRRREPHRWLEGRTLAMIFEKPSLRTRCTFETGMTQLGGHAIDLAAEHMQMGTRESVPDVARNLERWVDAIMARVFRHSTVVSLAEHADVPVINGLSDYSHPCQIMADLMTVEERKGTLRGLKISYIGDGFNIANSLLFAAGALGLELHIATPPDYEPREDVVTRARHGGKKTGAKIEVYHDPRAAADGADVIYTDSWISMGQEEERADRMRVFPPYQVNADLVGLGRSEVMVMHCLPAHRGEEITDEVMDGRHSAVFDQAENRLHAQKALLTLIMKGR